MAGLTPKIAILVELLRWQILKDTFRAQGRICRVFLKSVDVTKALLCLTCFQIPTLDGNILATLSLYGYICLVRRDRTYLVFKSEMYGVILIQFPGTLLISHWDS